jgi:2-hydroxychromene-2-carboxylate isomerase
MTQPLDFYFDFSSPYGYIASHLIDDLAGKHGREVTWHPILLGAVFKTTGGGPLTGIPLKGDYSKRDFIRTAKFLGVPTFKLPDPFPFSSIHAVRAFFWLDAADAGKARELARALLDHAFSGNDIASAQAVAGVAAGIGIDKDALLAGIETQTVKDRVRAETDAAMAQGVFGSPYVIADGEPFWGVDRFDQLDKWLETGGW